MMSSELLEFAAARKALAEDDAAVGAVSPPPGSF